MMTVTTPQQYRVLGAAFGARRDSCSCNPCDCNPCQCGDGVNGTNGPDYPVWRASGYVVSKGEVQSVDISGLLIVSVTQPVQEGRVDAWQEVILVDDTATDAQITALLSVFEQRLDSVPAEVGTLPEAQRAVYRATMAYTATGENPITRISFSPALAALVRAEADFSAENVRAWNYEGPMALRGGIDLRQEY